MFEVNKCKLLSVVTPAHSVFLTRQPQKKGVSPITGNGPIKPVKHVSSVNLSPCAPPVTNVVSAVEGLAVGTRLQKFCQVWAQKG